MDEKKTKHGLFSSKQPPQPLPGPDIGNISRRIKLLEQHYTNLNNRFQLTDQNIITTSRRVTKDVKTINSEINEIKLELINIKEKIELIIKELKESAKKEDIAVLKKYINLWDPMNFVTINQVEKIVKELIQESK